MTKGRTIRLYLVDGTPNGLITAEIMNWSGHVVVGPRNRLAELMARPEAQQRAGVYFLVGPESTIPEVYIGESDEIDKRLDTHGRSEQKGGKDFWERVCIVTSKDGNLTKGHVKYLESRFLKIAKDAARCKLLNDKRPDYSNLPEPDVADMEFLITQVQTLLPVLGVDILRSPPKPMASGDEVPDGVMASPVFSGDVKKHGITAQAQEINGEFVVMKGSKARLNWEGVHSTYEPLFKELLNLGVLVPSADGQHNEFAQDYGFSSASAAGAIVTGRSCNGPAHWIDAATGKPYGQWRSEALEASSKNAQ